MADQVNPKAIGYSYTLGHRVRELIGTIGGWVPWWGLLSVQRYAFGLVALYFMVKANGLWLPLARSLPFFLAVPVGLGFLLGPTVLVVVLVGRMEARNISPVQLLTGRLRTLPFLSQGLTEDGPIKPEGRDSLLGSASCAHFRTSPLWASTPLYSSLAGEFL